jgi:hypothetical protein
MKIQIDWPEVLRVSHSRIKNWRRCHAKHHYQYVQNLRKNKPPTALFVGTGVHTMLEAHLQGKDWKVEAAKFRTDFDKLFIEEKVELGDLPTDIEQIVQGYIDRYKDDLLMYVPRHRGKRVEIPVYVDLDSKTRFTGRIDAFPTNVFGENWVMDHKTCKSIPDEDSRYSDLQMVFYCWLLPHLGYPKPNGVIWDYIRKKVPTVPELLVKGGLSKNKSIDTTYEVYMKAVYEKLGVDALPQYEEFASQFKGRAEKFYRRIYLPDPSPVLVNNVVNDMLLTVEEIRAKGATDMQRNMGRDCKSCSYFNLCHAEVRGLDTEYMRKTEYTVKEDFDGHSDETDGTTAEDSGNE